jgi:hypothetical protein
VSPIGSSTSFDVRDLALDGGGNLFLTNNYNNTLLQEFLAVNGVLTTSSAVNTIAIGPTALAYDGQGHLFGATTLGAVTEYDLTTPSLSFGTSVPVGGSSTAESVTLQNEGSAPLVFATPSSGYNPATSSNFTLLNTSATTCPVLSSMTAPQSIAESSTCVLSYEFTPVVAPYSGSGVLTGTSVFTDNSASATTTATQSISLSGTATASGTYPTVSNSTFTIVPSKVAIGYSATAAVHETDPQGYAVYGAPVPVNVLNSSTAEVGGSYNQTYGTTDMNGNFTFGVTDTVAETVQVEISGSGGPTQSVTFVQPAYLVTTLTDDATGSASNCVVLATDNTNGNGSCSLRDAIAATNALPAGVSPTISFLSSLASSASPQTETVSSPLSISQNVIITGPGANALTLSGNNTQQIFYVSGGTVAINGLTLTKGVGALLQGTSGEGGAVWTSAISLTLTGDVLSYNTAGSYGGALYVSGGTTTIVGSTFNNNSAGQEGGAINNGGGAGALTVTNSTFSANSSGSDSGAVRVYNGSLTMTNVTMANNTATNNGGALYASAGNGVTLTNTLIAGNTGGTYADYNGDTPTLSGSVVGTSSSGTSTIAPALSALANYGGTTPTLVPQPGSPAICAGTGSAVTDQRGATHGSYCATNQLDAGAVQTSYAIGFTTQPTNPATVNTTIGGPPTISVTENSVAQTGDSIGMTDNNNVLTGTTTVSTTAGNAAFSALKVTSPEASEILTARLNLVSGVSLTVASQTFVVQVDQTPGSQSSLTVSPGTAVLGSSATVTATVIDTEGYAVPNATVTFGSGSSTTASFSSATAMTNASGIATVTLMDTKAEQVTVSATAGGVAIGTPQTVTFVQPTYLVTTLSDDASGTAANCVVLATSNASPNNNCSLRDAIAATNALSSGLSPTISFLSFLASVASPATLTIQNSNISIGGSVTLAGPGPNVLTLSGGGSQQLFTIGGNSVAISGLTLASGAGNGGVGGAIWVSNNALTLSNDVFLNNSATNAGGGLYVASSNATITNTTFSGNSIVAGNSNGAGAGLYVNSGTVTVTNSTFNGNTLNGAEGGGGIYVAGGTVTVTHTTISGNGGGRFGGGFYNNSGANTMILANDIVSGNTQSNNYDDFGPYTDNGGNVVTASAPAASPIALSALGNYGGTTPTMVPMPGSPAICAGTGSAVTDQRGASHGSYCVVDSGAVQTSYAIGFTTQPANPSYVGSDIGGPPTVNVTENGLGQTGDSVAMSGSPGTLTGTTTVTSSAGGAAFSSLIVNATETSEILTAQLSITSSINLTTPSSSFMVSNALPTVTGLSPAGGPTAGGTVVTITGTNFTAASSVKFGTLSATSVTYNSATSLTAVSPAESAGAVAVTVATTYGTSGLSSADTFTYYAPQTYLVTTMIDDATGNGTLCVPGATTNASPNNNCSLRDAITATNAYAGGGSISFYSGISGLAAATRANPLPYYLSGSNAPTGGGTLNVAGIVTITGATGTDSFGVFNKIAIDGGGAVQVLSLAVDAATMNNLVVRNGFINNGNGAGIYIASGTVSLNASTISNNSISTIGGGGIGAGICIFGGTVLLNQSTVSGNTVSGSGQGQGAGIGIEGGAATLTVLNSTISGNVIGSTSGFAGGIFDGGNTLTLLNSIITGNSQPHAQENDGGGLAVFGPKPTVNVGNTIISGNTEYGSSDLHDESGNSVNDLGGNFLSGYDSSPVTSLSTLGYYGGQTQTVLLEPGSSAICGGLTSISGYTIPTTDQRGATHSAAYCSAGTMDSGAVQTDYALGFTAQPGNAVVGIAMSPAPAVQLEENGLAYTSSSPSITLMDTSQVLSSGGGAAASPATYSSLVFGATATGDTLVATAPLTITGSTPTTLSATSIPFNVVDVLPMVTGISPAGGPLAGGTSVTISGTDFTAASTVKFGATSATSVTYVSATQLTATAPAEVAGAVHIVVTTADGSSPLSSADLFTYYAAQGYLVTTLTDDATGSAANCVAGATDNSAGNSACSLRDAITAANGLDGALGTINFWSGIAGLSAATKASPVVYSVVTGGRLNITGAVTINGYTSGSGASVQDLIAVDGGGSVVVFYVNAGGNAVGINNLTIRNGSSGITVNGGTVTVSGSTISGNTNNAFSAAGGITVNSGTAAVIGSTISSNTANGPSAAGGIVVNSGLATVLGSTISGNATGRDALESAGAITLNGGSTVTVTNSTISGNTTSASGSSAGAIYMDTGTLTVVGSTISGNNTGVNQAIGGIYVQAGTATLSNSIVSGNSGGDTSGGYTDNGGNEVGVSGINLSALGYYGGLTQTMVPLPGSPAICAGLVSSLSPAPGSNQAYTDQRGATHSAAYCSSAQLDAGAVQTSYALGFVQGPTAVALNTAMSPAPTVQVSEDGMSYIASTPTLTMTDLDGSLTAGGSVATGSNGVASFSGLTFGTGETSDTLTASLTVSAGGATVSTTSGTFTVGPQAQTITFPQPASPVVNGTATVMTASSSSGLAITYTVSGPATVSGATVTFTGDGPVTVTANQAGTPTYAAATPVSVQVSVIGDYIWVLNASGARTKLYEAGTTDASSTTTQSSSTVSAIAIDSSGDAWSVGSGANALNFANSTLQSTSTSTGGGLSAPVGVAVDGLGNVWVANSGNSTVSEFNSAGTAVTASTAYASDTLSTPGGIAIDSAGSLWVTNTGGNSVTEILGAAAPVVTPAVNAVTNSTLGVRP